MNVNWNDFIQKEKQEPYFKNLENTIAKEEQITTVLPQPKDRFKAFELCPINKLKVVILGQDPYYQKEKAMGLAFSVPRGIPVPPSLKNIYKEMDSEYGLASDKSNGDLTYLAQQGVLLLNTVLTVEEGKPLSHKKIGWETFTDRVLIELNGLKRPLVYLLWGSKAKEKQTLLDNPTQLVISTSHPSPLGAYQGFLGSNCFKKCNQFLIDHDITPIEWVREVNSNRSYL